MTRIVGPMLLFCLAWLPCAVGAAEIVVHPSVPDARLTLNRARLAFTMRLLRWPNGTRVTVFVLPDFHPLHREFAKRTLDLYPRQLRRVWDRYLYSGSGTVPVEVESVEAMARHLAETPGGIGYLPEGVAGGSVRVVRVE